CFLNCGINFKAIIITSDSLGMVLLNIYMNLSEVITILNALLQKITATSIIAIEKPYTNASSVIGRSYKENKIVSPLCTHNGFAPAMRRNMTIRRRISFHHLRADVSST